MTTLVFNPELAIRMSKPTRTYCPYGPSGGGTLDQELQAAPAKTNKREVELWLIDTGCAHDLVVSIDDIARTGDKLYMLKKNITFETANGGTISTHTARMNISELSENINPYVLKETPAVLSIGDRTMNKGYSFVACIQESLLYHAHWVSHRVGGL
eukprot:4486860-Heterocapsa_arctica.AAC.1